jgi:hypothetical protein
MSREPTSFNCELDHKEWMDSNITNKSEFLNDLIEAYRNGAPSTENTVVDFRARELQTDIQSLQRKLELKQEELEEIEESRTSPEEQTQATWDQALSNLQFKELNIGTVIQSSDETVQTWADRLDMDVDEFKQEALDRHDG